MNQDAEDLDDGAYWYRQRAHEAILQKDSCS